MIERLHLDRKAAEYWKGWIVLTVIFFTPSCTNTNLRDTPILRCMAQARGLGGFLSSYELDHGGLPKALIDLQTGGYVSTSEFATLIAIEEHPGSTWVYTPSPSGGTSVILRTPIPIAKKSGFAIARREKVFVCLTRDYKVMIEAE